MTCPLLHKSNQGDSSFCHYYSKRLTYSKLKVIRRDGKFVLEIARMPATFLLQVPVVWTGRILQQFDSFVYNTVTSGMDATPLFVKFPLKSGHG